MKDKTNQPEKSASDESSTPLPGYPIYPSKDDIYSKAKEETEVDPENNSKLKTPNELTSKNQMNEVNPENDFSGKDLDVPGSELDDADELTGDEDEENNSYSLGGDDHNDLDENSSN